MTESLPFRRVQLASAEARALVQVAAKCDLTYHGLKRREAVAVFAQFLLDAVPDARAVVREDIGRGKFTTYNFYICVDAWRGSVDNPDNMPCYPVALLQVRFVSVPKPDGNRAGIRPCVLAATAETDEVIATWPLENVPESWPQIVK